MYHFQDLVDILARLRGEGGCPWDAEQTHQSIKKNMIEEAYEALEAIDSGNGEIMADELGDLLLQIVFHAQIGKEAGEFTIDDVIRAICEKMIRRHPHVFGDVEVSSSADVLRNWEAIKKQEKGQKAATESMRSVSKYLPALMRAEKVQDKAAKAGLAPEKLSGQTGGEAISPVTPEEIGARLFATVNLARTLGIDAEEALTAATEKFIERFADMEKSGQK